MVCRECENLIDTLIKVVDVKSNSPFVDDIYHFEAGYKCTWNGCESLNMGDLRKCSCRLE